MPHPSDLSNPGPSASTQAFDPRLDAATSLVPQPTQRLLCPFRAKGGYRGSQAHAWRGPPPRSLGSRANTSREQGPLRGQRGDREAQSCRSSPRAPCAPGGTYRECTSGGRGRRTVSDPDLAAAAPVLRARSGRGLKSNSEVDVKGEPGGRARTHVWVGLGAGSEPGGAVGGAVAHAAEGPMCAQLCKGLPRPTLPPASEIQARAISQSQANPHFLFLKMWKLLSRKARSEFLLLLSSVQKSF